MAITRDLWIVLRARDEASRIVRSFGNNIIGTSNRMANNMSAFDQRVAQVAQRLNQFAMTSMLAGSVMAGFGAAGLHMLHSMVKVAAEYDRQVRHTLTQVDGITVSLEDLAKIGRNVARDVAIPFEQMQETLFFIFSSMNVTLEQSERLLRGFAKEAVAGQTTIEAAAKTTIAILNALGLTTDDLTRIQDIQFQVVRKGIITYEELSNVVGRALPATARAGQSFETLGAMIAFMTRNGLSAAMAATSAARAMESIAHPVTVKRLEAMGIAVRNARGEFMPLVDIMEQMNKKISKLSSPERAKFLQELFVGAGGTIQARRFWDVAFKNFGDFEEMIGFMANSTGVFQNAYETMAGSVAAKSELLRNKWMLIKEAIGRALMPHFLKLLVLLEKVLGWFDKLPDSVKGTIGQFLFWASAISLVVGILVVLVGTLAFFVSGIMMAGTALLAVLATIVAVTAAFIALGVAVVLAWQKSEGFRDTVMRLGDIVKSVWKIIKDGAKDVASEFDKSLRPSLAKLWDIIQTKVVPAVQRLMVIWKEEFLPKLTEAKNMIVEFTTNALEYMSKVIDETIIPAIEKLSIWWEKNSDSIRPFLNIAAQVVKWLLIIAVALGVAAIVTFITTVGVLIISVTTLIVVLKAVWNWIKDALNAVKSFFEDIGLFLLGAISKIGETVKKVKDFFNDAKTWLKEAGRNVIEGFIEGITEKAKDLRKKLKEITDEIPKLKGPKAVDLKLLFPTGMYVMKGLMAGIESQVPVIRRQLGGLTAQLGQLPVPTISVPNFQPQATSTEEKIINQYITVHTQEIDPRVHSMELGFDLANRL